MYDTYMSSSAKGKTRCPVCDFEVGNWAIKRHMLIHVDSSTKEDSAGRPHILLNSTPSNIGNSPSPVYPSPHQFAESTSLSWDTPSNASDDSNDETCLSDSENDDLFAGDEGINDADMFGDEMDITVDSYISTLSDKYDPKKVLKYLSWSPRPLTVVERESLRFLRNLSFGAGMSRAHDSQEWLDYTRDLGGALSFCFQIHYLTPHYCVSVYTRAHTPHILLCLTYIPSYTL